MYIVKINVISGTQGIQEPPARKCRKTMTGNMTCKPPFVDYDFGLKDKD